VIRAGALSLYVLFLLVPLYWLVTMSFKGSAEIEGSFTLFPADFTLENYRAIFAGGEHAHWHAFADQVIYVAINTVLCLLAALPAAYAFSRFRFVGDKHLFFWLLTNRMAPPMVFALPFMQLYGNLAIADTHWGVALAHTLFNLPLAVWILEGFMSGIPRQIDETAYLEGYTFPRFFVRIFVPLIGPGIGVAAFFCFMYSWIEAVLVEGLTDTSLTPISRELGKTIDPSGIDYGLLAAMGTLSIVPGLLVLWFVRNHIARGFALGRV